MYDKLYPTISYCLASDVLTAPLATAIASTTCSEVCSWSGCFSSTGNCCVPPVDRQTTSSAAAELPSSTPPSSLSSLSSLSLASITSRTSSSAVASSLPTAESDRRSSDEDVDLRSAIDGNLTITSSFVPAVSELVAESSSSSWTAIASVTVLVLTGIIIATIAIWFNHKKFSRRCEFSSLL